MAQFNYKVIDKDGKNKKGVLEASSTEQASNKLKAEGYTVIDVHEQGLMDKDIQIGFKKKVKSRDLSVFCKQFASILNAGVTIIAALDMIAESVDNPTMKQALKEAQAYVEKGGTLADAFRLSPKVFPPMLTNMVAAGEVSGSMELAFTRLATHFEKENSLQGKIKSALVYPVVVLIVMLIVVVVLLVMVIPTFTSMFQEMGVDLPLATRILVSLSEFMIARWYICVILVVGLVAFFKWFGTTETGDQLYSLGAINAPIFGNLTVKQMSSRFARNMSTLMSSGISLIDALEQVSKMMSNKIFRDGLMDAKVQISKGIPLSKPLKDMEVFPTMLVQMVKIGEETGNIEDMLDKVADFYDEEVDDATNSLTAAMEPLTMVLLAGVVGVIIAAVYGPIISMYDNLDQI